MKFQTNNRIMGGANNTSWVMVTWVNCIFQFGNNVELIAEEHVSGIE